MTPQRTHEGPEYRKASTTNVSAGATVRSLLLKTSRPFTCAFRVLPRRLGAERSTRVRLLACGISRSGWSDDHHNGMSKCPVQKMKVQPPLPYPAWKSTYETLRLWTQIVGKIRLMLTPWLNHSWHVPLYGKASPVHFFWSSFDLAITRFSGRRAPPFTGKIPGLSTPMRTPHRMNSSMPWSRPRVRPLTRSWANSCCVNMPRPRRRIGIARRSRLDSRPDEGVGVGESVSPVDEHAAGRDRSHA